MAGLEIGIGLRLAEWRGKTPIVVYQMGKVGSSTVVASLEASTLRQPIYHIHSLTREGIESRRQIYARIFDQQHDADTRRMHHLLIAEQLHKRIGDGGSAPKWKVITLVRDPVARNISDFFQVKDYWLSGFEGGLGSSQLIMDEIIKVFMEEYHHDEALNWFDVELKQTLGIDVFAADFPKQLGYKIYRRGRMEVLVLKLEGLNQYAQKAFKEFLGIDDLQMIEANVSSQKDYHPAYKKFQEDIKLPGSYLDSMYESKYARHFYTEEEIRSFKTRWRK